MYSTSEKNEAFKPDGESKEEMLMLDHLSELQLASHVDPSACIYIYSVIILK
jgi:hypothetical protein